ncbi:MAG: nucleoside-diphosphate kinase [Spirochaetia bacterium]|nr:nucleoside-diphosphate kinase [Spirochaetia bacterium]
MDYELSYVLVSPYTVAKSRIGGVLSRLLTRVDLELVGAQIFLADNQFAKEYAAILSGQVDPLNTSASSLLSDYVLRNIAPSGKREHRTLLLLFRGPHACKKLSDFCGALYAENRGIESLTGETIRDTYADLIVDRETGKVTYFEPAVLTPRNHVNALKTLRLLESWLPGRPNIVENVTYDNPESIERTLVIIKPENWNFASSRPGTIIDIFARTGLRIVGMKVHRMSVAEALEFYAPVKEALVERLSSPIGKQAKELLQGEFGIHLSEKAEKKLIESFGHEYADDQFEQIIQFMAGTRISECPLEKMEQPGAIKVMILVYEGEDAVKKIRDVLGPTDPLKAPVGTVRREFGSNIMVNSAHASATLENARREMNVISVHQNACSEIIHSYLTLHDSYA